MLAPPEPPPLPLRVIDAERAEARFGARFRQLTAALHRVDPIADAVVAALSGRPGADALVDRALAGERSPAIPEPLQALAAAIEAPPRWVEWSRIARAGRLLTRAGALGGVVLAFRSLVGGYVSAGGNKPLAFSGRLREQAPRRLAETGRFVTAVCAPGGMRPGAPGVAATVKVRLMHAQIRGLLARSGRWEPARWGAPINQHDMLGTIYLFSVIFADGLRLLGVTVDRQEGDDYLHLWRYVGSIIGVEDELMPWSEADARADGELIAMMNGEPDDDSRALVRALLEVPLAHARGDLARRLVPARRRMMEALCRHLVGDAIADGLGLARPPIPGLLPLTTTAIAGLERARGLLPRLDDLAHRAGDAYWSYSVGTALGGRPATFDLPGGLGHGPGPAPTGWTRGGPGGLRSSPQRGG